MEQNQQLIDDFLKQLKTGEELNSFLAQLQSEVLKRYWKENWMLTWDMKSMKRPLLPTAAMGTRVKK